jgi:hypothetical protein
LDKICNCGFDLPYKIFNELLPKIVDDFEVQPKNEIGWMSLGTLEKFDQREFFGKELIEIKKK